MPCQAQQASKTERWMASLHVTINPVLCPAPSLPPTCQRGTGPPPPTPAACAAGCRPLVPHTDHGPVRGLRAIKCVIASAGSSAWCSRRKCGPCSPGHKPSLSHSSIHCVQRTHTCFPCCLSSMHAEPDVLVSIRLPSACFLSPPPETQSRVHILGAGSTRPLGYHPGPAIPGHPLPVH